MVTGAAVGQDGSSEPPSETKPPEKISSETQSPDVQQSGVDGAPDGVATERAQGGVSTNSVPIDVAVALPQVLKVVGSVVAPTTLLTALMYYFGLLHAAGFLWYLGAQVDVLDLTIHDYLFRSVDGLIPPLLAVAGTGLVALWAHEVLLKALPAGSRRTVLHVLTPSAASAGLVLVSLAIADFLGAAVFAAFPVARGLSLAIGVLLLAYAAQLLRLLTGKQRLGQVPGRAPVVGAVAEWSMIFILVSIGLFWAVGSYAIDVGTGRARQLEASLPRLSGVVVYSDKRLSLQAPGIRELACQDPDAAYRFRYEGLKLVQRSGNQYLLLPTGWRHGNGTAILLPRSEALRIEFSPATDIRNASC
jgi:hypothetical protein